MLVTCREGVREAFLSLYVLFCLRFLPTGVLLFLLKSVSRSVLEKEDSLIFSLQLLLEEQ